MIILYILSAIISCTFFVIFFVKMFQISNDLNDIKHILTKKFAEEFAEQKSKKVTPIVKSSAAEIGDVNDQKVFQEIIEKLNSK